MNLPSHLIRFGCLFLFAALSNNPVISQEIPKKKSELRMLAGHQLYQIDSLSDLSRKLHDSLELANQKISELSYSLNMLESNRARLLNDSLRFRDQIFNLEGIIKSISDSIVLLRNENKKLKLESDKFKNHEIKTIKIGDQVWMAANLNVSKLLDGSDIKYISENTDWTGSGDYISDDAEFNVCSEVQGCYYQNNYLLGNKFGMLYNYSALGCPDLIPKGFHIPSDGEWLLLEKTLRNPSYESERKIFFSNALGGAFIGSIRFEDAFEGINQTAMFWSAGDLVVKLSSGKPNFEWDHLVIQGNSYAEGIMYIRCLKDDDAYYRKYNDSIIIPPLNKTTRIGNQVWMTKNLDVVTFRNGDTIPSSEWSYYNNDSANGRIYGKLYSWSAVNDPRGLAPEGFHIPSREEWDLLLRSVSDESELMNKSGFKDFRNGSNSSGFSALPGGGKWSDSDFVDLGNCGYWWLTNPDWQDSAFAVIGSLGASSVYYLEYDCQFSVRCIKNN